MFIYLYLCDYMCTCIIYMIMMMTMMTMVMMMMIRLILRIPSLLRIPNENHYDHHHNCGCYCNSPNRGLHFSKFHQNKESKNDEEQRMSTKNILTLVEEQFRPVKDVSVKPKSRAKKCGSIFMENKLIRNKEFWLGMKSRNMKENSWKQLMNFY